MNILVLYYSQSGQLKEILDALLKPLTATENISIRYEVLKPKPRFPFPWTTHSFCDAFPESFQEIPCDLEPLSIDPQDQFDLVILGYTVWYLSPSIPMSSFLQSPDISHFLKNRPVVTVIGCRNMWLMAQEKVKKRIADAGGRLMGNIVLMDRTWNLVGVATIAYWMLTAKKKRPFKILPTPGISSKDIRDAARFSPLLKDPQDIDQKKLNALGAVKVVPAFVLFEERISKVFQIWSHLIRKKGGPGDGRRRLRVRLFFYYLLIAIILIAPLATGATFLMGLLKKEKLQAAVRYFSQNTLKSQQR